MYEDFMPATRDYISPKFLEFSKQNTFTLQTHDEPEYETTEQETSTSTSNTILKDMFEQNVAKLMETLSEKLIPNDSLVEIKGLLASMSETLKSILKVQKVILNKLQETPTSNSCSNMDILNNKELLVKRAIKQPDLKYEDIYGRATKSTGCLCRPYPFQMNTNQFVRMYSMKARERCVVCDKSSSFSEALTYRVNIQSHKK